METKKCLVRFVRLDSILFDDEPNAKADLAPDHKMTESNNMATGPFTRSKVRPKANRTRYPRSASTDVQYIKEMDQKPVFIKNKSYYVRNIKPSASGPSEERVKAQTTRSEQPSSCLPGVPVPKVDPYDRETEPTQMYKWSHQTLRELQKALNLPQRKAQFLLKTTA